MKIDKIGKICNSAKIQKLPKHIGFIMDGNGRWAKKRAQARTAGHAAGAKTMAEIAIAASKLEIPAVTFYAFSTENWKRPQKEIDYIFKMPKKFFDKYLKELTENQIKINYIGDISQIPKEASNAILKAMDATKENNGTIVTIAINYGGRADIVKALKDIIEDEHMFKDINESLISSYLSTAPLPELELIIRTSGEQRLSNFLLWEACYAEFIFEKKHWPAYNVKEFIKSLEDYAKRNIRKGGISDEKLK